MWNINTNNLTKIWLRKKKSCVIKNQTDHIDGYLGEC